MPDTVTLLVGTTKGLFLLRQTGSGRSVSGPHCDGWPINHAIGDGAGRVWAAGGGDFPGAGVWRSDDAGTCWTLSKLADGQMDDWVRNDPDTAAALGMEPQPPAPHSGTVEALWSLARAGSRS